MDTKRLSILCWTLAGKEMTQSAALVALALLGANLNGCAPQAAQVAKVVKLTKRAVQNGLAALLEAQITVARSGKHALREFSDLLPRSGPPEPVFAGSPVANVEALPVKNDAEKTNADSRGANAFSPAQKAVGFSNESQQQQRSSTTKNEDLELTRLTRFAEHVCKIENAAAAVSHCLQNFGGEKLSRALEQFHADFTSRGRQPSNPPGVLIAWCLEPRKMFGLTARDLTLAKWTAQLQAVQNPAAPELRQVHNSAPEISPEESALIQAQQLYGTGKGPKPGADLVEAARLARIARLNAKPNTVKPASEAGAVEGGGAIRQT